MERGQHNLRSLLKENKLTIEERRKIAIDIEDAMTYLYFNGLHNADMKMENIIFVDGQAKICDFGLVEDHTKRIGNREMGYTRKGSKYQNLCALCKCFFLNV